MSPLLLLHWFLFSFLIISTCSTSELLHIPKLSPINPRVLQDLQGKVTLPSDFKVSYYPQTLDHFNYNYGSYETFKQQYVINSKYWGGASSKSPMLVYFGSEAPLEGQIITAGFLNDNAKRFQAVQLYIEHRFYGKSVPKGLSQDQAMQNKSLRGYFDSAQTLADYAEIILYVKEKILQADSCPVIVIGGSYGGMLASWFRLKYPHIAIGALASSAPILYFEDIVPENAYYNVVSKDFWDASQNCYNTIQQSWAEIDKIASQPKGLQSLSTKFKTCKPLKSAKDLKDPLISVYTQLAQYNNPPEFLLNKLCNGIDVASSTDILDKIFAGLSAVSAASVKCYVNPTLPPTETGVGWGWQVCSEMLIPMFGRDKQSMFEPFSYDLTSLAQYCNQVYGVKSREHWVTTYYGGRHIKLTLKRFGSNIIFSNGLKDPYSVGSVLEDISPSIVAVKTAEGAHCVDITTANKTGDPNWLVQQRETIMKIMEGWIREYDGDLKAYTKPIISTSSLENMKK